MKYTCIDLLKCNALDPQWIASTNEVPSHSGSMGIFRVVEWQGGRMRTPTVDAMQQADIQILIPS